MSKACKAKFSFSDTVLDESEDISLLTGDGRKSSVDNKTVYNTPDPIAASTVVKNDRQKARYVQQGENVGSFIEGDSSTMTSPPDADSLPMISMLDPVNTSRRDPSISSSLGHVGLIDLGNMPELSSSVLHIEDGPSFDPPAPSAIPPTRALNEVRLEDEKKKSRIDITKGGLTFGNDDNDVSVHEVKLDDEELQKFDEDFSDIGDFDNTLTDDSGEKVSDTGKTIHAGFFVGQPGGLDLLDEPPPERNPFRLGDHFAQSYFSAQQEHMPGLGEAFDGEVDEGGLFSNPNDPQGLPVNMDFAEQNEGFDEVDISKVNKGKLDRKSSDDFWERQRIAGRPFYGHTTGEGQEAMPFSDHK